jgi:hypothetical protein
MAIDLNYQGSFQRGIRFSSEAPIEEVWSQIARISTPEYASTAFKPTKTGVEWGKHTSYASVRIRQACELRNAGRDSSLLTRPITLYYSFLNLLRGVMALVPEVISPSQHGLAYKSNSQLLLCEAKLTPGTFGSYLDCMKLPWKEGLTISLQYCLSRIPEVLVEYKSPDRGGTNVACVAVQAKIGSGEARLVFDTRFVEESHFRTNWATGYPQLKDICELEEKGCVLKVKQSFKESMYEGLCDFCERNLWNSLVWRDDPLWHIVRHLNGAVTLNRVGYYFVAVFILGSIARYEPELLQSSLKQGGELEWFFDRFMRAAERFFPQLIFSWAQGRATYFPGV